MNWAELRQQMLIDPTVTYLNSGSYGPLPRSIFERVTALRQRQAEEPWDFLQRQFGPLLWQARQRLAGFLGGRPERLMFTVNVTASINIIANSLQLASPGEILLSDHEYYPLRWCWERVAQRLGLTVRVFPMPIMPTDPQQIIDAFKSGLNHRTRLAFFCHVLSPLGMVLPAKALCAEARKIGAMTVVDGAHAIAMLPLALDEMGCDFYAGNCHKWMLAPTGSAFLYLGAGSENRLQPMQVSWGYHADPSKLDERDEFGTTARLRFLEFEATREMCQWLVVPQAIDFQAEIGWQEIRNRNEELVRYTRRRVAEVPGLRPLTPEHPEMHGFMTAYRLPPNLDPVVLRQRLWQKYRVEVPIVERPEGPLVRVSTHFYNTEEEIDRLVAVLPDVLSAT